MASANQLKQQIHASIDALPEPVLEEVATFLEFLQYKASNREERKTPYVPVQLGGLWEGVKIADEDIAEVRREMWSTFGEREL